MFESDSIALISLVLSVVSIAMVVVQFNASIEQQKLSSLLEILTTNRELMLTSFEYPEFAAIFYQSEESDLGALKRYKQLWLNHMLIMYYIGKKGMYDKGLSAMLSGEVEEFLRYPMMRAHWDRYQKHYPKDFRAAMNRSLAKHEKSGAPHGAPPDMPQ